MTALCRAENREILRKEDHLCHHKLGEKNLLSSIAGMFSTSPFPPATRERMVATCKPMFTRITVFRSPHTHRGVRRGTCSSIRWDNSQGSRPSDISHTGSNSPDRSDWLISLVSWISRCVLIARSFQVSSHPILMPITSKGFDEWDSKGVQRNEAGERFLGGFEPDVRDQFLELLRELKRGG